MSPGKSYLAEVHGDPGCVSGGEEKSLLEFAEPILVKARVSFLRIRKKIGSMVSLDAENKLC